MQKFTRVSKEDISKIYVGAIKKHLDTLIEESHNWKLEHALIHIKGMLFAFDISAFFVPKKYLRTYYNCVMHEIGKAYEERLTVHRIIDRIISGERF